MKNINSLIIFIYIITFINLNYNVNQFNNVNEITYEKLYNHRYTNHVKLFKDIFKNYKVENFLEFGIGYGTKFFIDNCTSVTSIELLIPIIKSKCIPWYNHCKELYKNKKNWNGHTHMCEAGIIHGHILSTRDQNLPPLPKYSLLEIKEIANKYAKKNIYDVIFIDCGIGCRSDIVNEMFNRANIIVAHDTQALDSTYGWNRLKSPKNYCCLKSIDHPSTSIWINRKLTNLINNLKSLQTYKLTN